MQTSNTRLLRLYCAVNPRLDFQTATDAHLEGVTDLEVLDKAAKEGRVLVSHDKRTMSQHFSEFIKTETSSGLLIVSQEMPIASVVEELL